MHFVYFVRLKNNQTYTGYTGDLKRRWSEHKTGRVDSTRNNCKYLIGYEAYRLKSDALRREKYLKTTDGKRFFRQQYRDILESK